MVVITAIYFAFRNYTSEAEANFVLVSMILPAGISLVVKLLERYIKNRAAKNSPINQV